MKRKEYGSDEFGFQEKYSLKKFALDFKMGNIVLFSKNLNFYVSDQHLHYRQNGNDLQELNQWKGRAVNGVMFWFYPIKEKMPTISFRNGFICYLENRSRHFFLKIEENFEEYQRKYISPNSLATIRYEVRRYDKNFNAGNNIKEYQTMEEFKVFLSLARKISRKTWQERVLHAGLLTEKKEREDWLSLAGQGLARGYLLFAGDKPIAYAVCVIENEDVIVYRKIGFNPAYRKWSPGTVLFFKMLEQIFKENRFSLLDFMGGDAEHKRKFANDSILCANIYCFRRSISNLFLIFVHRGLNIVSFGLKWVMEKIGIRSRIKKMIRKKVPQSLPNRLR
jgi:hypothetical protein